MREKDYIAVIGSANMDVAGYSNASLNYADSNPGKINLPPAVLGGILRKILPCWEKMSGYFLLSAMTFTVSRCYHKPRPLAYRWKNAR